MNFRYRVLLCDIAFSYVEGIYGIPHAVTALYMFNYNLVLCHYEDIDMVRS